MEHTTIHHWSEVPEEAAAHLLKRNIAGQGCSLTQVEVPAGTKGERHSHPHEQFVLVLEGTGSLDCESGTVQLRPGTVLHFEKDAWHQAAFDTKTLLLEVNLVQ